METIFVILGIIIFVLLCIVYDQYNALQKEITEGKLLDAKLKRMELDCETTICHNCNRLTKMNEDFMFCTHCLTHL